MFPFLQFVNPAGRDSCLLLRGFLAKKEASSSVSDRVFLESRSSCCTRSITTSSWPTLRWLPLLKRSRLWSANLPERTTCPPSGGGEVRGPASILPGSAAGGAGCGQLPETLETLGGGAVLRDWEGGLWATGRCSCWQALARWRVQPRIFHFLWTSWQQGLPDQMGSWEDGGKSDSEMEMCRVPKWTMGWGCCWWDCAAGGMTSKWEWSS